MSVKQVSDRSLFGDIHADLVAPKEIETWVQALDAYDNQEFDEALRFFSIIADTSKILFNCGVIYATLGEHNNAVCERPTLSIFQTSNSTSYR